MSFFGRQLLFHVATKCAQSVCSFRILRHPSCTARPGRHEMMSTTMVMMMSVMNTLMRKGFGIPSIASSACRDSDDRHDDCYDGDDGRVYK